MEFQQRVAEPADTQTATKAGERLWLQDEPNSPVEPAASDRYVVVDERDDGILVLVIAPWPTLDPVGRLLFKGPRRTVAVLEAELAQLLERRRRRARQLQRPIRIGDTFLVRGPVTKTPAQWPQIVDVTGLARSQAKMAFHAAVAPKTTVQEAKTVRLETPPAEPEKAAASVTQVARPDV